MIWMLIKINIASLFAGMFKKYRNKKKMKPITAILIGLLVIYVVGALMLTVGMMFHSMSAPFFDAGIGWFYFTLAGIYVFALCFIGTVFTIQSQIFAARDNELLLSMPIKPSAILAGRLCALLLLEYVFEALILIPAFAVLIINGYVSYLPALGIVFYILAALVLPLAALAVGCLVGWLVSLVSSRMRNKNIITLILSIALLAAYFWFMSRSTGYMNALIENGAEIADAVRRSVFPAYHLGVAVTDGSILSFLLFTVCAIAPFALMHIILSLSFMKLVTGGRTAKKIEYREKTLRVSGARAALVMRELRFFITAPLYILNAALGVLAVIALTVVLIVRPGLLTDPLAQFIELMPEFDLGVIAVIVLASLAAINNISASSISLEGKSLWIVKSLPIPTRDVLLSKAGMHILVCGVPSLLAGIVCIVVLRIDSIVQIALMLVLPLSLTAVFSLLGVTLNLAFPRFDWINPIQPVKQGISSMVTLFGGMALIAALALVYIFLLSPIFALDIFLLVCTLVFITVSALMFIYIIGAGSRRFDTL